MPNDDDFNLADDLDTLSLDDFSLDEDFSLGSDTGSPEESQEGVFVKSEPEDLREEPPQAGTEDSDSLALMQDFSADFGDDALSSEELDKIGSDFDLVEAESPAAEADSGAFDEISLDDFVSFDDDADPSGGIKTEDAGAVEEIPTESEAKEEFLDIDISIEDEIDDQELEIVEGAKVKKNSFETAPVSGAEEIDLSEFADLSDSPSEDLSSFDGIEVETVDDGFFEEGTFDEVSTEETGMDAPAVPELEETAPEAPSPLDSLSSDDLQVSAEVEADEEEPFFEVGQEADFSDDFETVLSQEKDHSYDITVEPEVPDMDTIQALEDDLTSGIRQEKPAEASQAENILFKIEKELLSIKEEITSLKKEFTQLKTLPSASTPGSSEEEGKDFFSDDEDEVIALTGDELDNILSSAEITEEVAEAQEPLGEEQEPDLIPYDSEGNILDFAGEDESQSDVDLFSGTELEESLEDEIHVPESGLTNPIPGAMDLDTSGSIPEDLDLEPLMEDESQDILGSSGETFSEMGELELETDSPSSLSFQMEDQDAQTFLEGSAPEESLETEESTLEIPLDEDFIQDDDGLEESPLESEVEIDEVLDETPIQPLETSPAVEESAAPASPQPASGPRVLTESLREEIKTVLSYMDKLLENLPDDKIKEFADSEHFEVYKRLFEELGLTD